MKKHENPHSQAWEQFKSETEEHELSVLHDSGVFRHMRMAAPGVGMWSWSITTWPGHLAITGDIGSGYIFNRMEDMFKFFRVPAGIFYTDDSPSINPGYWGEKTQRIANIKLFSSDMFMQRVKDFLAEADDVDDARAAELILDAEEVSWSESEARAWLDATEPFSSSSMAWESSFLDYDHHFLLACYAIDATIKAYDARTKPTV